MKRKTILIALLASAMVFPLVPVQAAEIMYGYVSRRAETTTNSVVIWPAANSKSIVLKSFDVTGDNADVVLQLASGTLRTLLTAGAGASLTNLTVSSTNSFAPSDVVVVQRADGTSTSHFVYSLGASTINLTATIGTAASSGDAVYRMSHLATNAVGSATLRKAGEALWGAQIRQPLLLRLYSGLGTTEKINDATAYYSD